MKEINLSGGQMSAYTSVGMQIESFDRTKGDNKVYLINGYAGTGKTTMMPVLAQDFDQTFRSVVCLAPTNRAVSVLRSKFSDHGINIPFSTIHKIVYGKPNREGKFEVKDDGVMENCFVFVDESSMITKEVNEDLLKKFRKSFILYLGDDFQLEQIGTKSDIFNYERSDLTHVLRHDNGILDVATSVRTRRGEIVVLENKDVQYVDSKRYFEDDYIDDCIKGKDVTYITSTNQKRVRVNNLVRKEMGFKGLITEETLICINNNDSYSNGDLFRMVSPVLKERGTFEELKIDYELYVDNGTPVLYLEDYMQPSLHLSMIENKIGKERFRKIFGQFMDGKFIGSKIVVATLGFCISAHKSQGGQWQKVYVDFDFCADSWNPRRWLYTAVTRASEQVVLTKSPNFIIK